MAIYEYRCENCKKTIEVTQKMTETPFRIHSEIERETKCNGEVKRQLFANGIHFKGSGFYCNDYKEKQC